MDVSNGMWKVHPGSFCRVCVSAPCCESGVSGSGAGRPPPSPLCSHSEAPSQELQSDHITSQLHGWPILFPFPPPGFWQKIRGRGKITPAQGRGVILCCCFCAWKNWFARFGCTTWYCSNALSPASALIRSTQTARLRSAALIILRRGISCPDFCCHLCESVIEGTLRHQELRSCFSCAWANMEKSIKPSSEAPEKLIWLPPSGGWEGVLGPAAAGLFMMGRCFRANPGRFSDFLVSTTWVEDRGLKGAKEKEITLISHTLGWPRLWTLGRHYHIILQQGDKAGWIIFAQEVDSEAQKPRFARGYLVGR